MTGSVICSLLCRAVVGFMFGALATQAGSAQDQAEIWHSPELDAGFHLLYELKPAEARAQFAAWQKAHPEDPLGSASEAASYLFEECYRQGVLTSEFFLDDERFLGKIARLWEMGRGVLPATAFYLSVVSSTSSCTTTLDLEPSAISAGPTL